MNLQVIAAKLAIVFTALGSVGVLIFQAAISPNSGTIAAAIGYPVVLGVMWRMSRQLGVIHQFMTMYRIEHEIIMEWYEKETGQRRPASLLADAKKIGM